MDNKNVRMLYFVSTMILGLVLIVLTVITFIDIDRNTVLLPFVFATGSLWFAIVSAANYSRRRWLTAVGSSCLTLLLVAFAMRGFIIYWG